MTTRAGIAVAVALVSGQVAACGGSTRAPSATGNLADRGFLNQMSDHHVQAIELAHVAERRSRRPELRRLADRVVELESEELARMRELKRQVRTGTNVTAIGPSMNGISAAEWTELRTTRRFDRLAIDRLVPHLASAVTTARLELAQGRDPGVRAVARRIVSTEAAQVTALSRWRVRWFGAPVPREAFSPERGEEEEGEG